MDQYPDRLAIMSIQQTFAERIFSGQKKVELRRVRPNFYSGMIVAVYAPLPLQELIGTFRVVAIHEGGPTSLWQKYQKRSGVSETEFYAYFVGALKAVAIELCEPRRFKTPISLASLKAIWPNFLPPQSYRFLQGTHPAYSDLLQLFRF